MPANDMIHIDLYCKHLRLMSDMVISYFHANPAEIFIGNCQNRKTAVRKKVLRRSGNRLSETVKIDPQKQRKNGYGEPKMNGKVWQKRGALPQDCPLR